MIHDAHFHYSKELIQQFQQNQIQGIMNIDSIEEFALSLELKEVLPNLSFSVGIHPWKVKSNSYQAMFRYMEEADIIGEIGLDSVWCDTDLNLQRDIFQKEIQYAFTAHKPVILHTKGMEKEILDTIQQYPNKYLVHWYSCEDYLQEYIHLDCYFTIGPSIGKDPTVDAVAKYVPLNRILIESDGLSAIDWALDRHIEASEYQDVLKRSIEEIARIKQVDHATILNALKQNYQQFMKKA